MDTNGNIRNLFLPYNLALLAKEKGFDEECFGWFQPTNGYNTVQVSWNNETPHKNSYFNIDDPEARTIAAPLYQQIIDWFREEHNIVIEISEWSKKYSCKIKPFGKSVLLQYEKFDEYYEALNIIIEEAFKLI